MSWVGIAPWSDVYISGDIMDVFRFGETVPLGEGASK